MNIFETVWVIQTWLAGQKRHQKRLCTAVEQLRQTSNNLLPCPLLYASYVGHSSAPATQACASETASLINQVNKFNKNWRAWKTKMIVFVHFG